MAVGRNADSVLSAVSVENSGLRVALFWKGDESCNFGGLFQNLFHLS
jgi:hypothetical protein